MTGSGSIARSCSTQRVQTLCVVCMAAMLLVGCGRTIHPLTEGFHLQIPEKGTRAVVWGNHEVAVGAAVTWLQRKRLRLVERARLHEVLKEQRVQLTHSPEDEADILRVGRLIGANWVVFIDTKMRSNERTAVTQYRADAWVEYHLSVTVRGVDVESGEILWSGRAHYPKGVNNPEAGIIYLTDNAFDRAWCPEGKWKEHGAWRKGGCQE